jgi:hypothetical protein
MVSKTSSPEKETAEFGRDEDYKVDSQRNIFTKEQSPRFPPDNKQGQYDMKNAKIIYPHY